MPNLPPQLALDIRLDSGASFASYFVGANHQVADAVRALAEGRGEALLYLYGGAGLGKSHLLQAACRVAAEMGHAVAYLPLREAMAWSPDVLEGLESLSLVALDDIEAVANSLLWQEGLFHLFNRIREQGGRLLLAAEGRPAELGLQLPDLVSRLQWGLTLRLQDHDDKQKIAGLCFRARLRGLELPEETAHYLLAHYPRELTTLFGLLDRLDEASLMAQRRLTIPFVKQVLDPTG
jgi:DnaA family protein